MPETEASTPSFATWISPALAVITVILTFSLFYYFVSVILEQRKELTQATIVASELATAEAKFKQLSSAGAAKTNPAGYTDARSERDRLRKLNESHTKSVEVVREQQQTVKEIMMYILGVLSSALMTVLGYYFGSSRGSAEKTATLTAMAAKIPPPATPTPVPAGATSTTSNAAG